MLKLKNIVKNYSAGDSTIGALKGVSLEFRENEFVSILGPSGCGKTTMLNIVGGLDRYTDGDLIIENRSTKEFKDKDWDSYRNHKIGFVFQNYNLIPHQTVLSNVELALTLSGVSKTKRREKAIEVLEQVGLKDQIHKKPNQMSGGQMQRVAIARALVNDPDIILADEPTGALDTETSVQIMDILRQISDKKLIIMVTHNPELAEKYSTRIIRLLDGNVISDSNPYTAEDTKPAEIVKQIGRKEKVSMSFLTAMSLSFKNLLTKKGRTLLTAFAGSIGIIGIALILSLSSGLQNYIDKVQEDTISTYPITIEDETVNITSLMESILGNSEVEEHEPGFIYSNSIIGEMMNAMVSEVTTNSLAELKTFFESSDTDITEHAMDIQYSYDTPLYIYSSDEGRQLNPSTLYEDMMGGSTNGASMGGASSSSMGMMGSSNQWVQMIDNPDLLESQYNLLAGEWPDSYDEVVIVADDNYQLTDVALYALGLKDSSELQDIIKNTGSEINTDEVTYSYDEIMNLTFKLIIPNTFYQYNEEDGTWTDMTSDEDYLKTLVDNGIDIKVSGIIIPDEDAVATSITGSIGYTKALSEYIIEQNNSSEIVKAQLADADTDVFTGLPFPTSDEEIEKITIDDVYAYIATLPAEDQMAFQTYMSIMTEEQIVDAFKAQLQTVSESTYDGNLELLGYSDLSTPSSISIYAKDFESKDAITDIIEQYNTDVSNAGHDNLAITYTDYIGLMMSSVSTIINAISYVLIAFVSISLVVSSIMIGIITYISVLERTKEIGVLRSIGASKRDVSRVFNAETMIIGLVSGSLGIIITVLLDIPINIIIKNLTGISGVASLPVAGGVILILISVVLTFVAGLIPSRVASKKDPVIALRSE